MARVLIVGAFPASLRIFRIDLMQAILNKGHEVIGMAAETNEKDIQKIEEKGFVFRSFKVKRKGLNPLWELQTWHSLRRAFDFLRPELVLSYTVKPVIWSGLSLKGLKNIRFFALITGLGYGFYGKGPLRGLLTLLISFLYRISLKRAEGVFFQNADDRNTFVKRRIVDWSKCHLVDGSGIDLSYYDRAPSPEEGIVFLTIARLLADKGLREYAQAARIVKGRYPSVVFHLLGFQDPGLNAIPIDEIHRWEEEGQLRYLGTAEDVRPALRNCHVYVLPSYHEGMPRSVLEAMAIGRPILTTDVPGCRETVIPGENGFMVPKGDAGALAERMIWFIEHRGEWERMGRKSREIAERRFDVHKINRRMMTIMGLI